MWQQRVVDHVNHHSVFNLVFRTRHQLLGQCSVFFSITRSWCRASKWVTGDFIIMNSNEQFWRGANEAVK